MTRFLPSDEAVDFAESGRKRGQDRVACFFHLRDLVYLHPEAASASAVSFVQTLEAKVIAEKAAREKRLADVRAREAASRWLRGDRQKAAAETEEFPPLGDAATVAIRSRSQRSQFGAGASRPRRSPV
jgi:hypothetical protein